MAADSWMRAADRDREETVDVLRQAYAEGRLDPAELDERTGTAFQARTIGELRGLIADIPTRGAAARLLPDQPRRPGRPHQRRPPTRQPPRVSLLMLVAAFVCVMFGAATRSAAVITLALAAGILAAALARR